MFLLRPPSADTISRFLRQSENLRLSHGPIGIVRPGSSTHDVPEWTHVIGRGIDDFQRAREALCQWKHFDMGWVDLSPRDPPIAIRTVVAVRIRHLGFWSLNGCRVVYLVGGQTDDERFGFAYGTLTNHAESGEELFEVFVDPHTEDVIYRIRAISSPQAALAKIGRPVARAFQAAFRNDSARAMRRAIQSGGVRR